MNFLGHIYFSGSDFELARANLFGDFTKGKQYLTFPEYIQEGVRLHRAIDQYIDSHPKVVQLIHLLRPELPKVAPIAIDLYFDHLLAKNWSKFHPIPLDTFLESFYTHIATRNPDYPEAYSDFLDLMQQRKWINVYPTEFGLQRLCAGVGSRLSFPNALPSAPAVFNKNQSEIEATFYEYMRDANEYFIDLNSKFLP